MFWWAEVDSNHRSRRRQIYSLIHLAALESAQNLSVATSLPCCGAGDWTRTHNLLITNQLLCQLSYTGVVYLATNNNAAFLASPKLLQKALSLQDATFCGGQRWIRTTEVEDVRFTV